MKILVVCQYYAPEPFRHPDLCEELVKRGHEVTVVTGLPNYPMGEIYEGYRHGQKREELLNGVRVLRCFTVGRKHGPVFRFLNYYSYAFSSTARVRKLKEHYDVVFVNQLSPVMMAKAAMDRRRREGTPVVLYCLDLWPESLVLGGIGRDSALFRYFLGVSRRIYRSADRLLVTSHAFSDYFVNTFGIRDTEYLPQYAEAIFRPELCAKAPDATLDLMFAGNVGTAQSLDTVLEAAWLTADIPGLRWHIVGDGSELERLREAAAGMDRVIFHGRRPLEEMPRYYAMADAMLVTMQREPIISLTLPGKVQTYMAAGKPILGAIDGETPVVVQEAGCGFCAGAEDAAGLADCVRRFLTADRGALGRNAREYYERNFDKTMFMDRLEEILRHPERKSR